MPTIKQLVAQLTARKARAAAELQKLDLAIAALSGLGGNGPVARGPGRPPMLRKRRRMSAAARKRIADAQRARWAKYRAGKGK